MLGTGYQQEVHVEQLYEDVAEYNVMVQNPAQLPGAGGHRDPHGVRPGAGWRT